LSSTTCDDGANQFSEEIAHSPDATLKRLEDLNFRTCCDRVKFSADEFSLLDVVVDLVFEFLKLVAEARTWWRAVGRGFSHRGTVEAGVGAGEETAHRGARTG